MKILGIMEGEENVLSSLKIIPPPLSSKDLDSIQIAMAASDPSITIPFWSKTVELIIAAERPPKLKP